MDRRVNLDESDARRVARVVRWAEGAMGQAERARGPRQTQETYTARCTSSAPDANGHFSAVITTWVQDDNAWADADAGTVKVMVRNAGEELAAGVRYTVRGAGEVTLSGTTYPLYELIDQLPAGGGLDVAGVYLDPEDPETVEDVTYLSFNTDFRITPGDGTVAVSGVEASTTQRGLVSISDQSFEGVKTFGDGIVIGTTNVGLLQDRAAKYVTAGTSHYVSHEFNLDDAGNGTMSWRATMSGVGSFVPLQLNYAITGTSVLYLRPDGGDGFEFHALTAGYSKIVIDGLDGLSGNVGIGAVSQGGIITNLGDTLAAGTGISLTGAGTGTVTIGNTGGTVTSVGLSVPSGLSVSGSPVTGSGTLAVTWATTPSDGKLLIGTTAGGYACANLTAGSGISITNGDGSITIASSGSPTTQMSITSDGSGLKLVNDEATPGNWQFYGTDGAGFKGWHDSQDLLQVDDTDTVNLEFALGELTATVITQLSVTSDASGVKLSGDSGSPGNSKYYGTDGGGTKGFHSLSALGGPTWVSEPATATSTGTAGQMAYGNAGGVVWYLYICTATDTWKRTVLSSW